MPDITVTVTVSALENAMLDRRATKGGQTIEEFAEDLLTNTISKRFNKELEDALDELRGGAVTAKTQKLLKDYIDAKTQ